MDPLRGSGWQLVSLRPQGDHAALRRAAARHGVQLLALSPWRLQSFDDPAARQALDSALEAGSVIFTSPAAVRAAAHLGGLRRRRPGQHWVAVGSGTARALRRAGIDAVVSPTRMDSEGLLALPCLEQVEGMAIGLVTAPEGRDLLATTLQARGARVLRADVYARVPVALSAAALRKLRALDAPACLALSSGAALRQVITRAPEDIRQRLRALPVLAASARLAVLAKDEGFTQVELAEGPRPAQLLAAMARRIR